MNAHQPISLPIFPYCILPQDFNAGLYLPVTGIPENPCLSLISKISLTTALGPTATGSMIKPCSKRLTLRTSFAWLSIEQL